ncbi:MAG TPA: hypothetical protein VGY54_13045 [Polyangiaceae bacterium]|jgi:hypothetical protein|nr:hypothetical protein [Polyangiaceae bacterium]
MNTYTAKVFASLVIGATSSLGCVAHYATVDGYDAAYVEYAPAYVESYPSYRFHDGYVYEVHGHYYHQHGRRWVEYRGCHARCAKVEPTGNAGKADWSPPGT